MMWKKSMATMLFVVAASTFPVECAAPGKFMQANPSLDAWVVYWDRENGLAEFSSANAKAPVYTGISYFAAYFDKDGKLFLPEGMVQKEKNSTRQYLCVVNDVQQLNETSLKDTDILKKILATKELQKKHADEIIHLAQKAGCNGIDLDYERVFRDPEVVPLYLQFIQVLQKKAQNKQMALRVLLEPNIAYGKYDFPAGPQYVVMMYNLHGIHNDAGPKADFAFIRKTIQKMTSLPGTPGIALSTGGCSWSSTGSKQFISAQEVEALAKTYHVQPVRDSLSDALHFSYTDTDGNTIVVWYADEQTVISWIGTAKVFGITDISIWRMGDHEKTYYYQLAAGGGK